MFEQFDIPWHYVITVATTLGGYLLAFMLIPRIVLDRRESGATLAWILFIAIVPYLGAAFFLLIGRTRVRRRTKKKLKSHDHIARKLDQLPELDDCEQPPELEVMPEAAQDIAKLATAVTGNAPVPGNDVQVYIDANKAYDAMEAAIKDARHHVFMMSYIYRNDEAGLRFRDLLAQKAAEGVEVKLLVDGVGGQELNKKFLKPLRDAGASFATFMPVFRLRPYWRPNLRNHRKILVVDGKVGFAGGLNIGAEYQGRRKRYAPWRDTHLRLRGPASRRLQEIFIEDWLFAADEDLADRAHFLDVPPCGDKLVQVVDSGPDHEHETIHAVFFTAVNEADHKAYITTPYFVPDTAMRMALKSAAWRGVDVRLLLPRKSDLRLVQWAGRSYYKELLEAGVRIYEHHPGVLHAKTMVVDDTWATIGSANMDRRSFRLNFEVNVLISGQKFAAEMESIFVHDIKTSADEITLESLADKGLGSRMLEAISRILSPVL